MKKIFFLLKIFPKLPFRFKLFKNIERFASVFQGKGWGSETIAEEVNGCLSLLKIKPKIFIDIGANKGLYTSFLLNKIDNIECHLFEPSKHNNKILRRYKFIGLIY